MQDDLLGAIDLAHSLLGLHRNGHVKRLERGSGPPPRIEGLTISAPILSREPPHSGEMHPGRGSDSNGAESHAKRRFPDSLGVGGLALEPRSRIGTCHRD